MPIAEKANLSFSIIFIDPQAEPLDLIADYEQDYFAWTIGLQHLISTFSVSLALMKQGMTMLKVFSFFFLFCCCCSVTFLEY